MNLPKSTKVLLGSVVIVGSLVTISFLAQDTNDPKNEIETYLADSPLTENKLDAINAIEDEEERLDTLEGNLQTASRTISVDDEETILGENMITAIPTESELQGTTLFLTFDKTIEDVEKEREKIIEYSEKEDSLEIKVIYLNVEASYISGLNLLQNITNTTNTGIPPAAFVVKNGKIIWQDSVYEDLPYKGDI